jgi:type I restriction enzyme, R subunit
VLVSVPIFNEGRLPELRIIGNTLDAIFDLVFADRKEEEREAIKTKYATESSVAGAPKRVEAVSLDWALHQVHSAERVQGPVVACSREVACLYKETLERLNAPQSAIIISGSNKDDVSLVQHHTGEEQRKELVERFLKKDDPLQILVVCDMLLTGFDAQVRSFARGSAFARDP